MDQKPNRTEETPGIPLDEQNSILNDLEALVQKDKPNVLNSQQTTPITQTIQQTEKTNLAPQEFKAIDPSDNNLQERYKILKVLGEGGMGVVQLAYDQALQREIALKRIKSKALNSLSKSQQELLWRFQREASISAMLEHPNIVPLYDVQKHSNGEMFFTMRKIEGKTLREILGRKRQNPQEYEEVELLSIFLKVCDAMAYAHSKGVIHRDLKPDNVMIGQFGEVYVMDWGIAKILKDNQQEIIDPATKNLEDVKIVKKTPQKLIDSIETESLEEGYKTVGGIGTEGYLAPEQRENASQASSYADIYSLGKILRECYTLLSPIEEFQLLVKQGSEKLKKTEKKPTKNEYLVEENFSLDIQAIVKKATNENPLERYLKVEELSKDIQNYQKNKRVSARKYNFIERFLHWFIITHKRLAFFIILFSIL
ncbi:MAG: serine/threonine-protein kinase, partial [Planctomycetota bacterium]